MAKRIVSIVALVALVYLGYLGYQRYKANAQRDSGALLVDDTDSSSASESAPAPKPQPPVAPTPVAAYTAPATDTIAPNPTNGTAFTGTGKFQVYRQGNLTWRVDTESGHSCILFATMDEWKKPIVYSHGCNNS